MTMTCRTARRRKRRPETIAEIREALDYPGVGFEELVGGTVKGGAAPREDDEESFEPRPGNK